MTKFKLQTQFDSRESAIQYIQKNRDVSDAQKATVVAYLFSSGLTNKDVRQALQIAKVYTVTHLKRAGTSLTEEELQLWHDNPQRITLGHIRAIAKLSFENRDALLRSLLLHKQPVSKFEAIAQGKHVESNADIRKFERMVGDMLGREVKVSYNSKSEVGHLNLSFFGLDDLEAITEALQNVSRPGK